VSDAFFIADGDTFIPTDWTRGPWSPLAQHAGPPAALIAHEIERVAPAPMRVARFSLEIFRSISLSPMAITTEVARDGAKIRYVTASVQQDGSEVARGSAWLLRAREDLGAPAINEEKVPYPSPGQTPVFDVPTHWPGPSYVSEEASYAMAMDLRFVHGTFFEPGPAAAWMRPKVALLAGEAWSPLQRVLVAADSGNGISMELDIARYIFVNVDLGVTLLAEPEGEWVCLDAVTRVDPTGIGVAESRLWDETRLIGRGTQSLFVGAR
jgi:hypothetical protein